jgi:hypothetical protein
MTSLILAQQVERALRELVHVGPVAVRRAARRRARAQRQRDDQGRGVVAVSADPPGGAGLADQPTGRP